MLLESYDITRWPLGDVVVFSDTQLSSPTIGLTTPAQNGASCWPSCGPGSCPAKSTGNVPLCHTWCPRSHSGKNERPRTRACVGKALLPLTALYHQRGLFHVIQYGCYGTGCLGSAFAGQMVHPDTPMQQNRYLVLSLPSMYSVGQVALQLVPGARQNSRFQDSSFFRDNRTRKQFYQKELIQHHKTHVYQQYSQNHSFEANTYGTWP